MSQLIQPSSSYISKSGVLRETSPNQSSPKKPTLTLLESRSRKPWDTTSSPAPARRPPVILATSTEDWIRPIRHQQPVVQQPVVKELSYLSDLCSKPEPPPPTKPRPTFGDRQQPKPGLPRPGANEQRGAQAVNDIKKASSKGKTKRELVETAPKSSSTDKSGKKSTASPKSGSSKRPVTLDSDLVEPENKPKRLRPKAKPAFVSKGKEKEVEEEVVAHDIFHGLPPEARDLDNIDVEGMMPMFEMTSTPVYDPDVPLCPFCDAILPKKMSTRLIKLIESAKERAAGSSRPESHNLNALFLPTASCASVCAAHREESTTIPEGIAAGYPSTIVFAALPWRLAHEAEQYLMSIILGDVKSRFFRRAKKQWEASGTIAMSGAMGQMGTFEEELPGYYGMQGVQVIDAFVRQAFVYDMLWLTASNTEPLGVDNYIRRVMIPEAAVCLVMHDRDIDRADAVKVLKASRAFGMAVYPGID